MWKYWTNSFSEKAQKCVAICCKNQNHCSLEEFAVSSDVTLKICHVIAFKLSGYASANSVLCSHEQLKWSPVTEHTICFVPLRSCLSWSLLSNSSLSSCFRCSNECAATDVYISKRTGASTKTKYSADTYIQMYTYMYVHVAFIPLMCFCPLRCTESIAIVSNVGLCLHTRQAYLFKR